MFINEAFLRVIYADTDQMGYVYYGNYAKYYEYARTELLRALGITYKTLEQDGYMLTVYENFSKYLQPALYDDFLRIRVIMRDLPNVKWTVEYEIYNEANVLLNTGYTNLIFISKATRRPCRVPNDILEKMQLHFGK